MMALDPSPRPRHLLVVHGDPCATAAEALARLAPLPLARVLWVGALPPPGVVPCPARALPRFLGASFAAVVLDGHDALDADALGQAEGLVQRGGALLLRLGPTPETGRPELASFPFSPREVGLRFRQRLLRVLAEGCGPSGVIENPVELPYNGTPEQAAVVRELVERFLAPSPSLVVLLADRGRGKSSALGLALGEAYRRHRGLTFAICGASREGAGELTRFAAEGGARGALRSAGELVAALQGGEAAPGVLLVDEAAQLPVPVLQQLTRLAPGSTVAFASTCRGYEGTGRGFVLRFLEWARGEGRPLRELTLRQPIRFDPGDPLESLVARALVLDADLPAVPAVAQERGRCVVLDREELARDEGLLRQVFGLLVHAHYRTRPGDLERLLDAPGFVVHAVLEGRQVVGVSLVSREGGLPGERCAALARGEGRIQGHALPDTLLSHGGRPEAGELTFARSVRIAVHPERRRQGLARALVEHVHHHHGEVDAFGTLFGATAEVVNFRRSLGYMLVRVGASRGARTGEPAAVMVHPRSPAAHRLVASMQRELAWHLPWQWRAFEAEGTPLEPALIEALGAGLPSPSLPDDEEQLALVRAYVASARPADTLGAVLCAWVRGRAGLLGRLPRRDAALLQARWVEERSWAQATREARFDSVEGAMKAMRGAVRGLLSLGEVMSCSTLLALSVLALSSLACGANPPFVFPINEEVCEPAAGAGGVAGSSGSSGQVEEGECAGAPGGQGGAEGG
ncbi:MAG: GNAT family N-acetyltransferase [Polyangiaceae bacterium]|nr:GNAT family N-acetyltransferase [Polyangiaceae bacterium]